MAALEAEAAHHRAQLANVASIRVRCQVDLHQSFRSHYPFQSRPDYPSVGPDSIFPEESKVRYPGSRSIRCPHICLQRPLSFGGYANVVATLAAKDKAVRHCPYVGKIQVKRDDAKKPLSSALSGKAETVLLSRANDTDEAPVRNGIVELLKAILGDAAEVKTSPVASPSPAPSTSKSSEIVPKRSEVEPRQLSHTTVEECLGAMLGHFAQKVEAPASRAGAATSGSKPVEKKASAIESSLKAELEARLNNDQSNEIKDTIHAIFASLNSQTSNVPSPASVKGKEKAHSISTEDATSKDVVSSMEAVRNVEAAFHTLESEFVFPVQLDFTPAPSPASSDSESSLTGRLAYTSRNAPVRYYEQSLSGLLAQLDSVESFGNEALRSVRKEVVGKVESALEELEREVEGRWRSKTAKESKVTEKQGLVGAQAAEKVASEVASEGIAPAEEGKNDEPVVVDALAPAEAVAVHEDEAVAVDTTLPTTALVTPQPESTVLVVSDSISEASADKSSVIEDKELDTELPLQASAYPPSSASIDTVRPYNVEPQPSEDPRESFLLSEGNSADQETATKKKVDDDTGSDWSEVEA
ncbi:uncharacterized protein EV420DRAFT_1511280 [Desarmillaria tabescens]|uniref:BAG domain-containing protein n=1 Tax=Armillaria tabescens TaxID=1929756 RepID=A0AA39NIN8_ARMTA|nr:uncharacterized protein EV420DRAFT_1511280 [Desarmillaria tabescens]KAK0466372.1 hypothetical protein EV420DRAFT_1511280 [Desarmillaria tabescens]